MSQRVSLCMIVRDEEENLPVCLKGVADLVDEIVVVDTGSSDKTRTIAREAGAKVFDFPWCDDFAAARNESVRHATGDWVFWMDADDRIDEPNGERLARLFETLESIDPQTRPFFCMQCHCMYPMELEATVNVAHGRLFRNDSSLTWVGRVHERLVPADGGSAPRLIQTDVAICHHGYVDAAQLARKRMRNVRLLEKEFLTNPDDAATLFYIARDRLHRLGDHAQCLHFARRSLAQDPGRKLATTELLYPMVAYCLSQLNRIDEAIKISAEGLLHYPTDNDLKFERAYALRRASRREEARKCLESLLSDLDGPTALTPSRELLRCKALSMLGALRQDQGDVAGATVEFERLVAHYPASAEAHFLLGQARLLLGRRREAQQMIDRLITLTNGTYELAMLSGMAAMSDRDFVKAQWHLQCAIELRPEAAPPWILLSSALFEEGRDLPRCIEVHEKALSKAPHATEVRQRLERMRATPMIRQPVAADLMAGMSHQFSTFAGQ